MSTNIFVISIIFVIKYAGCDILLVSKSIFLKSREIFEQKTYKRIEGRSHLVTPCPVVLPSQLDVYLAVCASSRTTFPVFFDHFHSFLYRPMRHSEIESNLLWPGNCHCSLVFRMFYCWIQPSPIK
jgi:hypothetical protein